MVQAQPGVGSAREGGMLYSDSAYSTVGPYAGRIEDSDGRLVRNAKAPPPPPPSMTPPLGLSRLRPRTTLRRSERSRRHGRLHRLGQRHRHRALHRRRHQKGCPFWIRPRYGRTNSAHPATTTTSPDTVPSISTASCLAATPLPASRCTSPESLIPVRAVRTRTEPHADPGGRATQISPLSPLTYSLPHHARHRQNTPSQRSQPAIPQAHQSRPPIRYGKARSPTPLPSPKAAASAPSAADTGGSCSHHCRLAGCHLRLWEASVVS